MPVDYKNSSLEALAVGLPVSGLPTGMYVYFLINTCLTGLRSSGILSREVSVFIIIGLTARRGGEGRGKRRWRANTCALNNGEGDGVVSGAVPMVIGGKREFKGVRSRRGRMFERCKKSSAARRRGDMMTRLTVGGVSRGSEEAT